MAESLGEALDALLMRQSEALRRQAELSLELRKVKEEVRDLQRAIEAYLQGEDPGSAPPASPSPGERVSQFLTKYSSLFRHPPPVVPPPLREAKTPDYVMGFFHFYGQPLALSQLRELLAGQGIEITSSALVTLLSREKEIERVPGEPGLYRLKT